MTKSRWNIGCNFIIRPFGISSSFVIRHSSFPSFVFIRGFESLSRPVPPHDHGSGKQGENDHRQEK
jgi:hypothetical protein